MPNPIQNRCPDCKEEKVWDADMKNGEMHCPDCDYSRPIMRDDL